MDPNERLTGIAQMAPEMMGAPPIDAASGMMNPGAVTGGMTQEQMMAGPPPEMMGGMGMDPNAGMGMDPEMIGAPPPEEGGIGGDESSLLAEAVMERTQGDIGAAINVLDEAKAKLMASADQDPMMANMGGPMYMNMGGSVDYKMGGGPLYREDGGGMSDTDVLKQMIMNDVQKLNKGGSPLKAIPEDNAGLRKLPDAVRNRMGFMANGGSMSQEDAVEKLMRYRSS